MSATPHPDFEKLISRSLDAALTDDEQLEFNRALLRDPELRRTHDELASLDARAGEALRSSLGAAEPSFDPLELARDTRRARRNLLNHRAWWLMPAAAAALLAMTFVPWRSETPRGPGSPAIVDQGASHQPPVVDNRPYDGPRRPVYRVGADGSNTGFAAPAADFGPRSIRRITDRDMLGVMSESGNIYFFEVDRTRTLSRPKQTAAGELTVGDM